MCGALSPSGGSQFDDETARVLLAWEASTLGNGGIGVRGCHASRKAAARAPGRLCVRDAE
jgi:hypothetical protein